MSAYQILTSQSGWLNTSRALTADDLKGRIILLDFWTYCCINCMHVIPDLHYLEKTFGNRLTVIGVHSAKFKNEKDTENIRSAILRYGITHPVVNDFDFSIWKRFGIHAWPTFVLINPKGIIAETYSGEGHRAELERDIAALIKQYDGKINTAPLPLAPEKDKQPESLLSFPGKLALGYDGRGEEDTLETLFISDSGHNRIGAVALNQSGGLYDEKGNYTEGRPGIRPGHAFLWIGSGRKGFKDGSSEEAEFNGPQGVLFAPGRLYIADTGNHALRLIDLRNRTVTTLAGTGKQGHDRSVQNASALATALSSPWDLAFYPDDKHIAIAMAGMHQIWSYDIGAKTVSVIAGNGHETIEDGPYPHNALAQTSGLSAYDGKLYFADAETSSLRVLEDGEVKTLIGSGLFDFGFKDGKKGKARMQHPLGVYADASGIYVADSYNHSIRRYDVKTGLLSTFAGHGKRGDANGALTAASFNEPNDIVKSGDAFYVADTNNNAIRIIRKEKVSTLAIQPSPQPESGNAATGENESPAFDDNLINLAPMPAATVAPDRQVTVSIGLAPGWKINHDAPSYLTLFAMPDKTPVSYYPRADVEKKALLLPPLGSDKHYRLQGTLYYCEEKAGAQCLIKSFDMPLAGTENRQTTLRLELN